MDSSLAENSRKTYDRAWQVFHIFHRGVYGMPRAMPITPEKVAMFVASMHPVGNARTTIRTYISAFSREHKLADEDDPTAKFWVRKVVDAAGSRAPGPRVKRPIMLEILKKILLAAIQVLAEFNASLMRAVFYLAFHSCARIGAKHGFSSKGIFHHFCVLQTPQRECARYQNPMMGKPRGMPLDNAQRICQTKARPVDMTPVCVEVRRAGGGQGGQALPTTLLRDGRGECRGPVATQF